MDTPELSFVLSLYALPYNKNFSLFSFLTKAILKEKSYFPPEIYTKYYIYKEYL